MNEIKLNSFAPAEIENLHVLGRSHFTEDKCLPLFWTASGFKVNCTAGELWVQLEGDYSVFEPWVSVWVNGSQVSRFMVQKGLHWYCLFRGFTSGKINNFMLLKETQAMSNDDSHKLVVKALGVPESETEFALQNLGCDEINEEVQKKIIPLLFVPQERAALKIEFVGDSLTTGEGLAGGVNELDWLTGWMSVGSGFPFLTAKRLNADFRIVSQSGWGVTCGWDNDREHCLPAYYEKVCGVVNGSENEACGAKEKYNFNSWESDFVVVNLGTNDWGAFNNPGKICSATGEEWKLHLDESNQPVKEDAAYFQKAVYAFLEKIHACNPKAKIIWAYGMCCPNLGNLIQSSVLSFAMTTGVQAEYVSLPCMCDETESEKGSRQHPGPGTHKRVSDVLFRKINEMLG